MPISQLKKRSSRTVAARIHKLSGQLEAIERMVNEKRSCHELLAQIEAVRAGLASVAAILVNEEICRMAKNKRLEPHDVVQLTRTFIEQT